MSTFESVALQAFGEPLQLLATQQPTPGPGEVIVDVTGAGVCGTDVHISAGRMNVPLPLVLGHEAVGCVRSVGDGVVGDAAGQPLAVGDAVTWASNIACGRCYYCVQEGERSLCEARLVYGINVGLTDRNGGNGSYGQQMRLRQGTTIVRVPAGVSPAQVVALGCAGPTAVHAMFGPAAVSVGETVVVQGSGPVGLACAMYAKLAGASSVIMIGAPSSRLKLAMQVGACDVVINIEESTVADRIAQVVAMTPGRRGADLVVEATGYPPAVEEGFQLARRNGRYLVVGQYTDHGPTPLNPHLITKGQLRVYGSWAFSGGDYVRYVSTLRQLAKEFDLSKLVTLYPLAQANAALADMRSGAVMKAVLRPNEDFDVDQPVGAR
jgi:D-arabinose 1-dehydrogenase-like Zn-dependent alcohol dehydrogenase